MTILSQDVMRTSFKNVSSEAQFDFGAGRMSGLTPFSYVAGAIPVILDEQVSTNVLVGNFGSEVGLLTEASEQKGSLTIAGYRQYPRTGCSGGGCPGTIAWGRSLCKWSLFGSWSFSYRQPASPRCAPLGCYCNYSHRRFCKVSGAAVKSPFSIFNAVIAIVAGVIVLVGYFTPWLAGTRALFLQWAVILAAFALLIGVVNLLTVHLKKMGKSKKGGIYSLVLWVAFFITVGVVALDGPDGSQIGVLVQ